jgi:hypothetical protein
MALRANTRLAAVVFGLLQFYSVSKAQPMLNVRFSEIDFQAVEGEQQIDFSLSVMGEVPVELELMITPYTFEEYVNQIGRAIPTAINERAAGVNRAEETVDFPRQPVTITIPPSNVLGRDFQGSVSIEIDMINEPDEIFLLLVEPTEDTANDAEAPNIIFENNGLSIARIVDDDEVSFQFEQVLYDVSEADGQLPNTVQLVRDIDSELEYTFNISLRGGDTPATEGEDFVFMEDLVIIFPPSINRVSVPINILPDDQVELLEDFRLALVSQADNPSTNIRIGPNINTQVRINDDEVLKVGFDPDNLEFNEDEGEVTICAVILSPDVAMNVMAIFNIFAEPGTATNPEDYRATTREEAEASINIPQFFLDNNNRQACTSITIVNDTVGEGPETLQLMFVFSTVFTQVEVEGCPVNITIMDRPVNECEEGIDNCDAIAECRDLPDGFECICPTGFTGDGITCDDIDECELDLDNCSPNNARCINTVGSFRCECLLGFTGDGIDCEDIDECELGMDNCDPIARCVNTIGSFRCECPSGYSGDGIVCEGQAAPGLLSGPRAHIPIIPFSHTTDSKSP